MSEFPLGYEKIAPATWVYLSSLLMLGLYFKFNRVWSVRNLDLVMLILLAPGLLLIQHGHSQRVRLSAELQDSIAASERDVGDPPGDPTVEGDSSTGDPNDGDLSDGNSDQASAPEQGGLLDDAPNDELTERGTNPRGQPDAGANPGEGSTHSLEQNPRTAESANQGLSTVGDSGGSDSDGSAADVGDEEGEADSAENETETIQPATEEQQRLAAQLGRYRSQERNGYIFLFAVGLMWLVRVLLDPAMVRRPLLEPNLTSPGLTFLGCSLLVFLFANVVTGVTSDEDLFGPQSARKMVQGHGEAVALDRYKMQGPGYPLLNLLPVIPTAVNGVSESAAGTAEQAHRSDVILAKSMALFSQLSIVIGLVYVGTRHFNNYAMGIGAATLYLMLPYTAQMTGRVSHALPAALIIWAIAFYRRPLISGCFLGLAMGTVYYPLFLLPLWASFYWRRGLVRFSVGFALMVLVLGIVLAFTATSVSDYLAKLSAMFGVWSPQTSGLQGIWALGWYSIYRLPILAAFIALSITFAFWPNQKNFGTLVSCSCALMIAVQFWHGFGGGLYMAWYLPLLLLTIFRPNLQDRVALTVLDESRFSLKRLGKGVAHRSAAA